ncbi:MAG: hypothetical protein QUS33_05125, partial [Dehalococcoidia bacterium]|nr:hypothetical protein [Dehalococcoidia bacterium]
MPSESRSASPVPSESRNAGPVIDFGSARIRRYNRIRHWKDRIAGYAIGAGGVAVLASILLIFLYLLYEVAPMFMPASVKEEAIYALPAGAGQETLYLSVEEQNEIGLRVTRTGQFLFFNVRDGSANQAVQLPLAPGVAISSFAIDSEESRYMVFGLSNGSAIIARHQYRTAYPEGKRVITPWIEYPYGEQPLPLSAKGSALRQISLRQAGERVVVIANDGTGLAGIELAIEESFDGERSVETSALALPAIAGTDIRQILIDLSQQWIFVLQGGKTLHVIDNRNGTTEQIALPLPVQEIRFLLGGISLLVASRDGTVSQWFMVRDENGNSRLTQIRQFEARARNGLAMAMEPRRKGFATVSDTGYVELFHATAEHRVYRKKFFEQKPVQAAFSPRANKLLVLTSDDRLHVLQVDNRYPEVSLTALWGNCLLYTSPSPRDS